jgi:hypothetical protein
MDEVHEIKVVFPDETPDVAGRLAESLASEIRRSVKNNGLPVEPTIARTDPTAQDFGATLVLALGTPAIIILARAILDWAKRTNRSGIELNGVRISNLESRDVSDVVTALKAGRKSTLDGKK